MFLSSSQLAISPQKLQARRGASPETGHGHPTHSLSFWTSGTFGKTDTRLLLGNLFPIFAFCGLVVEIQIHFTAIFFENFCSPSPTSRQVWEDFSGQSAGSEARFLSPLNLGAPNRCCPPKEKRLPWPGHFDQIRNHGAWGGRRGSPNFPPFLPPSPPFPSPPFPSPPFPSPPFTSPPFTSPPFTSLPLSPRPLAVIPHPVLCFSPEQKSAWPNICRMVFGCLYIFVCGPSSNI